MVQDPEGRHEEFWRSVRGLGVLQCWQLAKVLAGTCAHTPVSPFFRQHPCHHLSGKPHLGVRSPRFKTRDGLLINLQPCGQQMRGEDGSICREGRRRRSGLPNGPHNGPYNACTDDQQIQAQPSLSWSPATEGLSKPEDIQRRGPFSPCFLDFPSMCSPGPQERATRPLNLHLAHPHVRQPKCGTSESPSCVSASHAFRKSCIFAVVG